MTVTPNGSLEVTSMSDDRPDRPEALEFQGDGVADELVDRDHWLVWQYEWQSDRDEWAKIPKDGAGGGYRIDATDPENGVAFDVALETYESGDCDGLGIITDPETFLVGFDFDDCRDPEQPHGSVPDVVTDAIADLDTYIEVSPSGTGYRGFAFGVKPEGRNRADLPCDPVLEDVPHLEVYDGTGGRYLTVTGQHLGGTPEDVETRRQEIEDIYNDLIGEDDEGDEDVDDAPSSVPTDPVDLEDAELLEKAKDAENGDDFRRLWNGDTSMHSGDHSRADLALCGSLAFWTGGDRQRIDSLFRDSGLMRDKWDEDRGTQTYGERTISKALEGRTEFYDPDSASRTAAATDGGAGATTAGPDVGPDGTGEVLTQSMLRSYAGLTGDDDKIADLNDREKAAYVWMLVKESDEVHVRVNRENDEIWAFDPGTGTWNPDGERALRHAAKKAVGSVNYGGNVLEELKAQVRADELAEVWGDEFGLEPGKVAVKNGLLDLEKAAGDEGALRDLEPGDYALTRLSVEYDPDVDGAEWQSFIDDVVEDDMTDAVQEYIGYCLHREATFDRSLLLVGGGANGKSTFLNVMEELLGDENTTNVSPYDFGDKPSMAELHGALANISADLAGGSLQGKNLGNFKKLTGGDTVTAKRLYKDPFKFTYDGGMLFAANEVPDVPVSDDDAAFWRRWIIVHFDNYFPEGSDKRDPTLEGRLQEPENLSAVLNWAIEGWARLMDESEFTGVPATPDETRRKWQKWGDSVDEFLSDVAVRDPDAENISTGGAFEVYRAWCRGNDRDAVGRQTFTSRAKGSDADLGYTTSIRTKRSATPVRGYAAFGTCDEFADPIDVLEGDGDTDDRDGGDGDGHNAGLESFDGADGDGEDEDSSEQADDVQDDVDEGGGDPDDDTNSLEGEPLGPHIVQYVRENQSGRDGVPREEVVDHLLERGAAEKTIEHWIGKCLERGDIGEPATETYTV